MQDAEPDHARRPVGKDKAAGKCGLVRPPKVPHRDKAARRGERGRGGGKGKPARKRRRAPVSAPTIRMLAMETLTLADAERQLEIKEPLNAVFRRFPKLQIAWRRGRFLRDLRGLAAAAATISEAAQSLGMTEESLRVALDEDLEVRDVWNESRIATAIRIKAAMVQAAGSGRAAAVNHVLSVLRREVASPRVDFRRLPVVLAEEAVGVSRQSLHAWWRRGGAPRNADGTIDLPALWKWREDELAARGPSARSLDETDPLKAAKAAKLQQELRFQKGRLLDRGEVVSGLVARHQRLVAVLHRKAAELSIVLQGQSQARIGEALDRCFSELRSASAEIPEFLHLPDAMAAELADWIRRLALEGDA